jgi:rubrerythrin
MSITLAQAIKNAIVAEHAAQKFYLQLAARCASKKTHKLLTYLAGKERGHATKLEGVANRLVAGQLPERAELPVQGIEGAPPEASAEGLGVAEALTLAIDAEDRAALYYQALASTATGEVAIFFEHLVKEEKNHAATLRALLAEVRLP